jgi:hypothetical protein
MPENTETTEAPRLPTDEELNSLRAKFFDMHLAWMSQGAEVLTAHGRLRALEELVLASKRPGYKSDTVQ